MTGQFRYGELGDEQFQQLIQATLVAERGAGVQCLPLNQADGGRDIADGNGLIFQVKFSDRPVASPATWLRRTLVEESKHFKWLVSKGMTDYYIVTNIEGSAAPDKGDRAKIEKLLDEYQKTYKVNFFCWWRAEVDAHVVALPREIKFHFGDMLRAHEYAEYMFGSAQQTEKAKRLRRLLADIASAQYESESDIRFKQDEDVHGKSLTDLFIDVEIESELSVASARLGRLTGGACQALLATNHPGVLLRGAPGQGKSTLLQYACQCYRAAFLNDEVNFPRPAGAEAMSNLLRFPIRVDLKDYASWITRGSTKSRNGRGGTTRHRARAAFKQFLASYISKATGQSLSMDTLNDLLDAMPMFVGLDGLDEVADLALRSMVAAEVDKFTSQVVAQRNSSLVVVTTRPSFNLLPEPTSDLFTPAHLLPLSEALKGQYIAKWAGVYRLTPDEVCELQEIYRERSKEPYFSALTENPMQMTVILPLIHKYGAATPRGRTKLYEKYMDLLFAREVEKNSQILTYQDQLEEVTPYLAWRLQSEAEDRSRVRTYTKERMVKEITHFLVEIGAETSMADDLFTGAWQRIWVLTCKDQVHFEFDVQSVREYFAAKFLANLPERDGLSLPTILLELSRREYWANTTRFLAGFIKANALADLADTFIENFDTLTDTGYRAVWALLSDGIFRPRPNRQRGIIKAILANPHATEVAAAYMDSESVRLAPEHGGRELVDQIRGRMEAHEDNPVLRRLEAAHATVTDFLEWWEPHLRTAIGTADAAFWLTQGGNRAAASEIDPAMWDRLDLDDTAAVRAALNAGASPSPDTTAFAALLREALDGEWNQTALGISPAHDLISLAHPSLFAVLADPDPDRSDWDTRQRRQVADRALLPVIPEVHEAMKGSGAGQKGTTSIWQNSAYALSESFGPTWLAACIAIIGSLTNLTSGGNLRGKDPLGTDADFGQLIFESRAKSADPVWWRTVAGTYADSLSQRIWGLAFVCKARQEAWSTNLELLNQVIEQLDQNSYQRLLEAATIIACSCVCPFVPAPDQQLLSDKTTALLALFSNTAVSPGERIAVAPQEPVLQIAERENWLSSLFDRADK